MIKNFKRSLSFKIFFVTFLLLGVACSGTYLCIIKLLPLTYFNLINNNIVKASVQLVDQLSACNDFSECEDVLKRFSEESDTKYWLENESGEIVYPKETYTETIFSDTTITFDKNNTAPVDTIPSSEKTTNYYPVTLKNGDTYMLVIQVDLLVIQQTTEVLRIIFPYVVLMILLLSLLCSWFYAKYITRPIVQLSLISKQMAELDFSGKCNEEREDELGCLARNLNSLSNALSTALSELQTANRQLRTDMEEEQELERQRVDFFSAASHELKTPLTILKGHLMGMLNNISGYENHMAYMERSLYVVDKMEILVKELLYISRVDNSKNLVYKTADIAELIRVQIAGVTDLLVKKKQNLHVDIPDKMLCEFEQFQMERAIQNILVNAIRYSPNGEQINISLICKHDIIRCEIENTGIYIPDDALIHLFEAFYRVDTSRNRDTGGTGLGLYIVYKVMEMHHAEYGIKNTNNGVLFWFQLPKMH